jgi:fructose-bisphosphate aldolase class II
MKAVINAAEIANSPVIIQVSVKTVNAIGIDTLFAMWTEMSRQVKIPLSLHLDHCPDRTLISQCLKKGWGSVLFDASAMTLDENRRQCIQVITEARLYGAGVEGEIDGIKGIEDGMGSDTDSEHKSLEASLDFIRSTGIDCFAPAIGNAHGVYAESPQLDTQLVSDITTSIPIPIALHGGTGLSEEQFKNLISFGCAKVNISTALKITFMQSNLAFLRQAETNNKWDPLSQFNYVSNDLEKMATDYFQIFGSVGRA